MYPVGTQEEDHSCRLVGAYEEIWDFRLSRRIRVHFGGDTARDLDGRRMEEQMSARWDKQTGVIEGHAQWLVDGKREVRE